MMLGWWIAVIAVLVAAFLFLRQWLLLRASPPHHAEPFDGVVYRVGKAAVVERGPEAPRACVIAMHGFVEDFRYFTRHYDDPRIQFIGLNSCDYHVPVRDPVERTAAWARTPSAPEGSIRYDAEVLCQALEHLPRCGRIRVHGHSRGGAVTLEAASLRPELFRGVEVILEAPVLPQGAPYRPMPAFVKWLLPYLIPLWRMQPINPTNIGAWGSLDDPRKRELIEGLPFNPRHISTLMRNLKDMDAWMPKHGVEVYRPLAQGAVLVPDKDRVLAADAMAHSAESADGLDVIRVPDCSHFVLFDRPDAIPALLPR